jgi:hypothetical protein
MKIKLNFFGILFIGFTIVAKAQTPSYVPTNALLAWFPFDNNSSDVSGNNNNGANNNVTFISDRNGNPNAAGSFNGINAWLEVASPSFTFAHTDSFTYSVWVNKDVQPAAGVFLMVGSNAAGNFISILQGPNNTQFGTNKQQSAWIWTTCPHTLNVWDHYVATYNAGIMRLYRNGTFESTTTFTHTNVTAANLPLYIGRGVGGAYFKGAIDDVGIWGRALSDTEINNLYNSTVTTLRSESEEKAYSLTPNLASDFLQLNAKGLIKNSIPYTINDTKGAVVMQGNISVSSQTFDIKNLSKGIYFMMLNDEHNTRLKFVKL